MSAILMVAVDCSECGDRAIEYATEHARESGARLYVTHIIEWSRFSFSTVQENAERHKRREEELQRAHSEIVDPIVDRLKAEGLDAEGLVRHGHVADTLNVLAKSKGVSNIILGRQGSSNLKSHVFGSVGSRLVQSADCAVTVVP
ncbi:MAG: universal stress protein [Gammaproteobacteria bacterium]|nr:universal stress protein [Gammaproteobacteria bacterium]